MRGVERVDQVHENSPDLGERQFVHERAIYLFHVDVQPSEVIQR